ncbi:uncharacterized protein [Macrobrachium rosenbergii]|uniref:uncharacterized protein n=1 Tax=Macrobrachium rosenbergii TaxID=79674 RepID=UPI0034D50F3A
MEEIPSGHLPGKARRMAYYVYKYFVTEKLNGGPLRDVSQAVLRATEATKLSEATIHRCCKEARESEENYATPPFSNKKKRKRSKPVTNIDDFDKCTLRRIVLNFYVREEKPNLDKILCEFKENTLFSGSKESLRIILKEMGFKYGRVNGKPFLLERPDVVSARTAFLRKMKIIREKGSDSVIYIDETWVNQNYTVNHCWMDTNSKKSNGSETAYWKRKRLVILHAGSKEGFVQNADLVFESKNDGDYHHQMNSKMFEEWFKYQLLPNIPPSSILVLDNASYHSVRIDKPPTMFSIVYRQKDVMKEWLKNKGANPSDNLNKCELLEMVKSLSYGIRNDYVIDRMARDNGHQVVRLPPYHCEYNPIELIWAQVKTYVAKRNNFKMADLKPLVKEAIQSVTAENWANAVKHSENLQIADAAKDICIDKYIDSFVIELRSSDDEDSS